MEQVTLSGKELALLAADKPLLFYRSFFPKAVRGRFASFHQVLADDLEDPSIRQGNFQVFRGGAKTTLLRMFMARRIAYGVSRTILYLGASEQHAVRSIAWIKTQVQHNKLFRDTFQLTPGSKWTENEIQILNKVTGEVTWILGVGITGSIRGINFDDYRPDLIVLDDVLTDENVLTKEGQEKMQDLILGAVVKSLAPPTEAPNAKMVMLQTPIHLKDPSCLAIGAMGWTSRVFSCWTPETMDLSIDLQESSWPERFTSEFLRNDKRSHIDQQKLTTFLREMECRIVAAETSAFRAEWLQYWDNPGANELEKGFVVVSVDPVPPPSEKEVAKGLVGKNFEAVSAVMRSKGKYYLLGYALNRGHNPTWTATTVEHFVRNYGAAQVVYDATAYQRVLGNTITHHLQRHGVFVGVLPITDNRAKFTKIVGSFHGLTTERKFFVSRAHTDFIADFSTYPTVQYDDLLDSVAIALQHLVSPLYEQADGFFAGKSRDEFSRKLNLRRIPV